MFVCAARPILAIGLVLFFSLPAAGVEDIKVSFEMISPSPMAGEDVRLKITLHSESGRGFTPAMLDSACFHVEMGDGTIITPRKEGLKRSPVLLGGNITISRKVNVGPLLEVEGCDTVRAWWDYKDLSSEKISFGLFQWPLDKIETVIETEMGVMVAEFFPHKAPRTVGNFVRLAEEGFYDGLSFHRVIPDFMIQGGCPNGEGTGGPGYTIAAEFNDTPHERGVLSMARGESVDSAGSQFFIIHADSPHLDWNYTAFGRLVSGFDVLDKITAVETTTNPFIASEQSRPVKPPRIVKMTNRLKKEGD